jgi:hypothetical protein
MYSISVSSKHHKQTKYQFTAFPNKDISSFEDRSVVDEGALKQVHMEFFNYPLLIIIPPVLHTQPSPPHKCATTPTKQPILYHHL